MYDVDCASHGTWGRPIWSKKVPDMNAKNSSLATAMRGGYAH